MSTYQCLAFFYVIDVIKSFLLKSTLFKNFLQHSIYQKEETYLFNHQNVRWEEEKRNLPQIKTQQKWRNDYPLLDFSNNGMKCLLCCPVWNPCTSHAEVLFLDSVLAPS